MFWSCLLGQCLPLCDCNIPGLLVLCQHSCFVTLWKGDLLFARDPFHTWFGTRICSLDYFDFPSKFWPVSLKFFDIASLNPKLPEGSCLMSGLIPVLPALMRAATTKSDFSMGRVGTFVRGALLIRARYPCASQGASNGSGVFGWEDCDCSQFQNAVPENICENRSMAAASRRRHKSHQLEQLLQGHNCTHA